MEETASPQNKFLENRTEWFLLMCAEKKFD